MRSTTRSRPKPWQTSIPVCNGSQTKLTRPELRPARLRRPNRTLALPPDCPRNTPGRVRRPRISVVPVTDEEFAAVLDLARVMIFEATLDFLGLGLQPPTPTLGTIIADGRKYLINAWWVASLPGVFLIFVLLAANMVGVALERARNRVLGGL